MLAIATKPEQPQEISFVAAPGEPIDRYPPRFRWLKRFLLAAALLLLLLTGVRWWWGRVAQQRLDGLIAESRRLGQPIDIADFLPRPVDERDNAACDLIEAARTIVLPRGSEIEKEGLPIPPDKIGELYDEATLLVVLNERSLRLARQARDKTGADWGVALSRPVIDILLPELSTQRQLAKLLISAAVHAHAAGDDSECVERLRDGLNAARRMDEMRITLIGHLVAVAEASLVARTVNAVAPSLAIRDDDVPGLTIRDDDMPESAGPRAPTRAQVRALMDELQEDRTSQAGALWAAYGERLMQQDAMRCMTEGLVGPFSLFNGGLVEPPGAISSAMRILVSPAWKLDGARMFGWGTQYAEASVQADWPAAKAKLPKPNFAAGGVGAIANMLSGILYPSLDRALQIHFKHLGDRRSAAVGLAIRLFEIDHGRRPETLGELTPAYLAAIPVDPADANGNPLAYVTYGDGVVRIKPDEDGEGGRANERP